MTRKLSHVPYWLYCLILSIVATSCFILGRWSQ